MGRLAAVGLILGWATLGATASAGSDADFDWYGLGGCTLPVLGMPIDFDAVSADVPAAHRDRLVTAGTGDGRQAVLVFVLGRCPVNSLRTREGTATTREVIQVMVGALYDARRATDADKAQFFLLSSVVDWEPEADVTLRITRRGRLYARYRHSLPAGRSTVMVHARRPVRPGTYRLRLVTRGQDGSRTTTRRQRVGAHRHG